MKTKILSIMLMFVVMSGISKSTYANSTNSANVIVLNDIKSINKIEVHGNVQLFISDNAAEQVTVYNKYYSESALVQNNKGVLRISSYSAEKLIVWVTSNNLRSVSAYDNADVRSFGDVTKIEFNIDLHDNATAKLNFNSYSAEITLRDHSKLEMGGTIDVFSLNHSPASTIVKADFMADRYTETKIADTRNKEIVGLQ